MYPKLFQIRLEQEQKTQLNLQNTQFKQMMQATLAQTQNQFGMNNVPFNPNMGLMMQQQQPYMHQGQQAMQNPLQRVQQPQTDPMARPVVPGLMGGRTVVQSSYIL